MLRHLVLENAIAGRAGLRDNMSRGVAYERQGSTDAAADRIRGCPGWAGRGPLGLPDSPPGQQGIGRGAAGSARRSGRVGRDSDAATGPHHRRLSPGLTASRGSTALGALAIALIPRLLADTVPRAWAPLANPESDDGLHTRPHAPGTLVPGLHSRSAAV